MKKIKEKPTLSECIKEKAVSTPRELLRKGLDDGSERLRTQLRDTAQHGQADEYGGDTIEDTAARGLRRAEKELTRQRKKKPQEQPPEGGAPAADATEQKPSANGQRQPITGNLRFQGEHHCHHIQSGHYIQIGKCHHSCSRKSSGIFRWNRQQ